MRKGGLVLIGVLVGLSIAGVTAWGALALWFALPVADAARAAVVLGYSVVAGYAMWRILRRRRPFMSTLPYAFATLALFAWWSTIEPSNERQWQPDVRNLAGAEIDGDFITLRNIRSFRYRSETDFAPRWYDKTLDLRDLDSLDLIAVYWMGDAIAHTFLSFGFGDERVAISIEIRRELGETYSSLAGLFRRYELYYVVGDESDLIGLRTTYREPPEDVYLYRVKMPRENIRALFLQYVATINELRLEPEFYNTATTNCTTNIVTNIEAFKEHVPWSWKMLLSGYFAELVYERGALDQSHPFDVLRRVSLINELAVAADGSADFSRRIREGLPGMP